MKYENILREGNGLAIHGKGEDYGPYQLIQGGEYGKVVATLGRAGSGVEHAGTWLQREAFRMAEVVWLVCTDLSGHPLVKDVLEVLKITKQETLRWRGKIVYPTFAEHVKAERVRLLARG